MTARGFATVPYPQAMQEGTLVLVPRRMKHRKQHHPKRRGAAKGGTKLAFGDFGIQALSHAYVTNRQIESARIAMTRHIRRGGKVWINIFPDRPLTKKPAETRMGSGKGSPEWWVANVKPGSVIFELSFPNEKIAREALVRAAHKLPVKCRIIRREDSESELQASATAASIQSPEKSIGVSDGRWRVSAWINSTQQPPKVARQFSIDFQMYPSGPNSTEGRPAVRDAAEVYLVLIADQGTVSPDGYHLHLSPNFGTRRVRFAITPHKSGPLNLTFRVQLYREGAVLQMLKTTLPVQDEEAQ